LLLPQLKVWPLPVPLLLLEQANIESNTNVKAKSASEASIFCIRFLP
jgi:hypothetical protein